MTHKNRARRGEPYPDPASFILRGHPLAEDVLRANAIDNYDVYGFYGISVFHAADVSSVDTVLATKLRTRAQVAVFTVVDLTESGLLLWDTGAAPHYDVVRGRNGDDLDELVQLLLSARRATRDNPHFREGEDR